MNPIISLKNIDIFQKDHLIFKNISFEVEKGEFLYLVGKTGSGKSSLLKTLYAELKARSGDIQLLDFDLTRIKETEIPFLRIKIGIIFQDFQLLSDRNLEENLIFILKATGWKDKNKIKYRIKEVLNSVHLENLEHKMPYELSGGEQQRAVIARSLLNHPEIILADEPTGNLDPVKSEKIIKLLQEINLQGTTVLIATHDYNIIKKFPSHTFKCENGTLIEIDIAYL